MTTKKVKEYLPRLFKNDKDKSKDSLLLDDENNVSSNISIPKDLPDIQSMDVNDEHHRRVSWIASFIDLYPDPVVLLDIHTHEIITSNQLFANNFNYENSIHHHDNVNILSFMKDHDVPEVKRAIQRTTDFRFLTTTSNISMYSYDDRRTKVHPIDVCCQFNAKPGDDIILLVIK
jgi:hypothetical protein